ncbi:PDR/VanB family oxidoreductase [Specibacter sp. RAF43]|uniref:PDR/VanB family oxidoreductase n=1 Tax=Specibacter sp. RAF43 TaxID=3233057 RepID=UPI003F966527
MKEQIIGAVGPSGETQFTVVVSEREDLADGVIGLVLQRGDGGLLPHWTPGAHIDLVLDDGLVRQYSLCGDPADRFQYRIAVLREPQGRGGSLIVHDRVHQGHELVLRGPRNNFVLREAPAYLFVAGGIGITPLLPMIQAAEAAGANWHLAYGGRKADSMAFRSELLEAYDDRISIIPQDTHGMLDLARLVGELGDEELVYCCGPEGLLEAIEATCARSIPGRLLVERFSARAQDQSAGGEQFEVFLSRSGLTLQVPHDRSILEVVAEAGISVVSSCQEGICGSCETRVLSGTPEHRDQVLDDEEREENSCMMICVSRAVGSHLDLDL